MERSGEVREFEGTIGSAASVQILVDFSGPQTMGPRRIPEASLRACRDHRSFKTADKRDVFPRQLLSGDRSSDRFEEVQHWSGTGDR